MRSICLLFIVLVVSSCSNGGQNEVKKVSSTEGSISITSIDSTFDAREEFKTFPSADTSLHSFFSSLDEVEKFIDRNNGVFCLESDQGPYTNIEKLKSKEDLIGKTPFLFLCRDISFVKNRVFINSINIDPCSENLEGYYLFNLKGSQTLLQDLYSNNLSRDGTEADEKLLLSLKQVDQSLKKSVFVSFVTKHGDTTMLRLYFTELNGKVYLSVIDLRDCSA
ncbi:MAG: hypothetical protein ACK50A_10195 [Sphingobacteriaceae bacterium]